MFLQSASLVRGGSRSGKRRTRGQVGASGSLSAKSRTVGPVRGSMARTRRLRFAKARAAALADAHSAGKPLPAVALDAPLITISAYVPAAHDAPTARSGRGVGMDGQAAPGEGSAAGNGASVPPPGMRQIEIHGGVLPYQPDTLLQRLERDKGLRAALNMFRPMAGASTGGNVTQSATASVPGAARPLSPVAPLNMHVQDRLAQRVPVAAYRQTVEVRLRRGPASPEMDAPGNAPYPYTHGTLPMSPTSAMAVARGGGGGGVEAGPVRRTVPPQAVPPQMRRLGHQAEVVESSRFLRPAGAHKRLHGVSPASDSFHRCGFP